MTMSKIPAMHSSSSPREKHGKLEIWCLGLSACSWMMNDHCATENLPCIPPVDIFVDCSSNQGWEDQAAGWTFEYVPPVRLLCSFALKQPDPSIMGSQRKMVHFYLDVSNEVSGTAATFCIAPKPLDQVGSDICEA